MMAEVPTADGVIHAPQGSFSALGRRFTISDAKIIETGGEIDNPELDANQEVIRGRILWHSKDRDEVYRKLLEFKPKRAATHYTGTIPDDAAVVL